MRTTRSCGADKRTGDEEAGPVTTPTVRDALLDAALPFWETEAEIARRFFARGPSREDHIFWLRAQLWRELHPADGYYSGVQKELSHLAELFPRIGIDVDRHQFGSLWKELLEEFNHYVSFSDILESLTGAPVKPDELIELPASVTLGAVRHRYATSGNLLDSAAVHFTDNGGGRVYREGAKLSGGPLEDAIAKAMRAVHDDHEAHLQEAYAMAAGRVSNDDDLERMIVAIVDISHHRLAMRREMFRDAMSADEIEAFVAATRNALADGTYCGER